MFAVAPEITSKENCEGDGARLGKGHADTVCTEQIRRGTVCVERAGQVKRALNTEKVLQEKSPDKIDLGQALFTELVSQKMDGEQEEMTFK